MGMIWEDRIRDAIAHGYVTGKDGSIINILNNEGINILGDIIESSEYSVNSYYYGALRNTAHIVLGRQGDPHGKFKQPPGVMEHFETATRDPAFFRLHKYMNNIFKEFKDRLEPYTKEDFLWEGVDLQSIEVEGSLETYFEDFEFSLANAVDDTEEVEDVPLTAVVKRLNHKPFSWKMQVENSKGAATVASARIFMCPRRDANGVAYHANSGRWGCIEMDKFYVELAPGANTVVRDSKMSTVTIPDIPSLTSSRRRPKPQSQMVVNNQVLRNSLVAVVSPTDSTCPRERKMVWRWYSWPSLKMLNKIRLMTLSLMSTVNLVVLMLTVVSMARRSLMCVPWDTHLIGQLLTSR